MADAPTQPARWRPSRAAVLLAASAALNAVLLAAWLARPAPAPPPARAAAAPEPAPAPPGPPAAPACPPAVVPPPAPVAPAPEAHACRERVTALERDLAKITRRFRGAQERFERGAPDAASDERVRPHVERILGAAKRIVSWQLACRDRVCRVLVRTPWERRPEDYEWMRPLQTDAELLAWTRVTSLGGGGPDYDPATREGVWEQELFFDLRAEREEPDPLGARVKQLADELQGSSLLDLCTRGYAEQGTFAARFTLGPGGLSFRFGGSLTPTAAGACLADRIRAAVTERLGEERPVFPATAGVRFTSPPPAPAN